MASGFAILNAGGTIAMRPGPRGLEIDPDFLPRLHGELEQLGINPAYLDCFNLEPPIASTSATPAHWLRLAEWIRARADLYRSFIILHGTDTLAYSAAALTLLLRGLGSKNILLTGAQHPLPDHEARANLLGALYFARRHDPRPRPLVFFGGQLLDGLRVRKMDSHGPLAFQTPTGDCCGRLEFSRRANGAPQVGGFGGLYTRACYPNDEKSPFVWGESLHFQPGAVALLYLTPDLAPSAYEPLLADESVRAVIVLSYGRGNLPADERLRAALKTAAARGVLLYNLSQCWRGGTDAATYALGGDHLGLRSSPLTPEALYVALHCQLAGNGDVASAEAILSSPNP